MIKDTGQDLYLVSSQDGEVIDTISADEKIIIRSKTQAINDKYWSPPIKIKGRFVKAMEREDDVVNLFIDSPATYLALNKMKKYLQINENTLIKNGRKYRTSDLAEDVNICRQTASYHIKKLKEMNLIAELDKGRQGKFLVINPNYYIAGDSVPMKTYKLFVKNS